MFDKPLVACADACSAPGPSPGGGAARGRRAVAWGSAVAATVDGEAADVEGDAEAGSKDGEEEPVFAHPEDGFGVVAVPGGTLLDAEETPGFVVVSETSQSGGCLGGGRVGTHSSGIRIRTRVSSSRAPRMYSFQTTERKRGPVPYMTVIYGTCQLISNDWRRSMTLRKNGCCGAAPIASFEIPVGTVRRSHAL